MSFCIAAAVLLAALSMMLVEAQLSRRHERLLAARGAVEPPGDVYRLMKLAYPVCFVAIAAEGAMAGPSPVPILLAGLAVFGGAKALKFWAISALGMHWSFRVLVLPGQRLVNTGPYRFLRHPNYLAVCGELAGAAMIVRAPIAGAVALAGFGALMLRRIGVEERALQKVTKGEVIRDEGRTEADG